MVLLEATVYINVVVTALEDCPAGPQTVYVLEGVWMDGQQFTATKVMYHNFQRNRHALGFVGVLIEHF
jgi:hypothetical protein